jgi:hypothetical protein
MAQVLLGQSLDLAQTTVMAHHDPEAADFGLTKGAKPNHGLNPQRRQKLRSLGNEPPEVLPLTTVRARSFLLPHCESFYLYAM